MASHAKVGARAEGVKLSYLCTLAPATQCQSTASPVSQGPISGFSTATAAASFCCHCSGFQTGCVQLVTVTLNRASMACHTTLPQKQHRMGREAGFLFPWQSTRGKCSRYPIVNKIRVSLSSLIYSPWVFHCWAVQCLSGHRGSFTICRLSVLISTIPPTWSILVLSPSHFISMKFTHK